MNSHIMPNLVGLRGGSPSLSEEDQAKHDILIAMQMEALGGFRREVLLTTDFKDAKTSYVPIVHLESQRLVNKSSIGKEEKSRLEGWNNAWTRLKDDGTNLQNPRNVNEGMGQTHRAKLMYDDSVREYTGEANFREGGRGGRGGRGDCGRRRGGNAGRVTRRGGGGKAKGERRVTFQNASLIQAITRVRVPKAHHPNAQTDVPRRQPVPILKTVSAVKPAKVNINIPSVPTASTRRPNRYDGTLAAPSAFMASIGIGKEQARDESSIEVASSAANTSKEKITGHSTDTSNLTATTTTSISIEKAMAQKLNTSVIDILSINTTAAGKPVVSVGSRPEADLMDLDISQETMQPVLQFTATNMKKLPSHCVVKASSSFDQQIEALETSGVLSATQLEVLKSIQKQVHARENPTTPVEEALRQVIYTRSELESLRPAAGAPKVAAAPKVTTGIAKEFAEQQNAFLIGEHVHKTRYHTAASLTEDYEKLSISDQKSVKPAATNLSTTEKSRINPFGLSPVKGKGPSLPTHLLNQITTADHGTAARAQYVSGNDVLAPVPNRQSLGDVTGTARPTRRNMINQTGFIALAENRVNAAARKKGEDSLLVARKRDL